MKRFVVVRAEGYMTSRPASSVFVYTKTILRCKILVGNTQTLDLHCADAGCAFLQNTFLTFRRSVQLLHITIAHSTLILAFKRV